jgi:hypothetical protein
MFYFLSLIYTLRLILILYVPIRVTLKVEAKNIPLWSHFDMSISFLNTDRLYTSHDLHCIDGLMIFENLTHDILLYNYWIEC